MNRKLLFAMLATIALAGGVVSAAGAAEVCPNLYMVWHDPQTGEVLRADPYACGSDLCNGYRCKSGNEISPACYSASQCAAACDGECVDIQTAQLDCATMCATGGCGIEMTWYKGKTRLRTEPYECSSDACGGYRCLVGQEVSPACYNASQCAKSCRKGTCISIPELQQGDCDDLCSLR